MFDLPDLNELAARGVEVTIDADPVVWNGKTRLVGVEAATDERVGLVTIETKAGAIRHVRGDYVKFMSVRPAPVRLNPDGSVRSAA
jgi:hypothetical protein